MKIENSRDVRVLQDGELDLVGGGFHDVELRSLRVNPLDIVGFNPQPDPPARLAR